MDAIIKCIIRVLAIVSFGELWRHGFYATAFAVAFALAFITETATFK